MFINKHSDPKHINKNSVNRYLYYRILCSHWKEWGGSVCLDVESCYRRLYCYLDCVTSESSSCLDSLRLWSLQGTRFFSTKVKKFERRYFLRLLVERACRQNSWAWTVFYRTLSLKKWQRSRVFRSLSVHGSSSGKNVYVLGWRVAAC